jgi:uncharacterized membrane protein YgcG
MIKNSISFFLFLGILLAATLSYAVDINLINVDMGSDDNSRMANTYGQAYGYTPQQVMPAMYGPPQEVPAIMQIAQAAGQVPMTVWMMRRMGMGYGSILSTFALAPSVLAGGPVPAYGMPRVYSAWPSNWARWTDPFYFQTARINFIKKGIWLPPGIAKKYGLWIPPGQAKKMGWGPGWGWNDGDSWKGNKHGWKGHDGDWDRHSWKGDDEGPGKGKSGNGEDVGGGKGNGSQGQGKKGNGGQGSGQDLAKGNGSSKGSGSSKGKGGSQGGTSFKGGGGGQGKGK